MRLLEKRVIQKAVSEEEGKDFAMSQQRKIRIANEIKVYNTDLDDLKRSKEILEKDFALFCRGMNEKRRELQKEIASLEGKKLELTKVITNLLNKIRI